MAALEYPAGLPCPQTSTVTPAERRALSDSDRPRDARPLQRDRLEFERITWPPMTEAQSAEFDAWWRETLTFGGAWFAADWPLPRGMVTAVRKFREQPRLQFVPGGFWRISALCEVRGRGMLPSTDDVLLLVGANLDFNDESRFAVVPVVTGAPAISSVTKKLGAGSGGTAGAVGARVTYVGDHLDLGNHNEYTIELWRRRTSDGFSGIFIAGQVGESAMAWRLHELVAGVTPWAVTFTIGGVTVVEQNTTITPALLNNEWYHLAVTRQDTTYRLFIDGTLNDTQTFSGPYAAEAGVRLFGQQISIPTVSSNDFLDEIRISSTCRYTASFTPQTEEFPRG
jgi:hypothetical protein